VRLGGELLVAAVVGGGLFALTGQPIIWVIAGIAAGALVCRFTRDKTPNARVRKAGQLLIGAAIGPGLATQDVDASPATLALLAAAVLAILLASIGVARVYSRTTTVDGLTAGMATLPGGIGIMPSVAAEYGRPVGLVAIVQSFRMTVVLVMALVVSGSVPHVEGKPFLPQSWWYVGVLIAGSVGAAWLAGRLRIPVPTLLGPLLFGLVLSLGLRAAGMAPELLAAPFAQEIVGQVLLGITVGEYLAQRYVGSVAALLGGLAGVVATGAVAMLVAGAMTTVSTWSYLTCLLIVAPGGAPEMAVIAAATGGQLPLVLVAQTGRQVLVNLLMPFWLKLFGRFD
jgi:membrane AbrB-like protein